ncbi:MAG: Do family serine endopeptidase [Pseudomonadota bacterium]
MTLVAWPAVGDGGAAPRAVPQSAAEITLSFAPIVRQTAPAVVNIYTRKVARRRTSPFAGDPFFERFFQDMFPGRAGSGRRIENSLGSGVIVQSGGIIVSNYHVIEGADEITVILQDRREFPAEVIFEDPKSDLAVLRVKGAVDLPTLEFRDSDTLEVGDLVLAIGNPFGVGQTVTSGIISGLSRSAGTADDGVFIQTDAAINPGNSGGALVDVAGRLVGINTAILSRSGGSNGIGFAVPANLVARVVEAAVAGQTQLTRPWFGYDGDEVDGELAAALGLPNPVGVHVDALYPGGPFAEAGVLLGDVIVEIDGLTVNAPRELDFRASTERLGETIDLTLWRDGAYVDLAVVLTAAEDSPPSDRRTLKRGQGLPGLTVTNINPAVLQETGLSVDSQGILVLQTQGPARRVGLRPGDLIRTVNGATVRDVAELAEHLNTAVGQTELGVERQGRQGVVRYRR